MKSVNNEQSASHLTSMPLRQPGQNVKDLYVDKFLYTEIKKRKHYFHSWQIRSGHLTGIKSFLVNINIYKSDVAKCNKLYK